MDGVQHNNAIMKQQLMQTTVESLFIVSEITAKKQTNAGK
jgi:hypothetical protein